MAEPYGEDMLHEPCPECSHPVAYKIFEADWMWEAEPWFPCDSCGAATCGFHFAAPRGDAEYRCPNCLEGQAYQDTVNFEYNRSRGV